MTTAQVSSDMPKPSFAKVVAASREQPAIVSSRPATSPPRPQTAANHLPAPPLANGVSTSASASTAAMEGPESIDGILTGLKNATLEPTAPSLVVNGSGGALPDKFNGVGRESSSGDSASDLGAKPPSLDGKSITSGTTFALDEKESLRPDDSASVKAAAVEDDDAFSIRGSLLASSRMGSDVAVRRILSDDISERRVPQHAVGPQAIAMSQGVTGQQPATGVSVPTDALNVIYRKAPDEKLLEAMQSPKDRIFLLRLEKDVVDFVRDSKEPYMDLPPCNSFCRMLTHKLADYYHMTHSFEPNIGSVRIFRTPFCRVPPSLASIVEANTAASSTPPPVVIPRKIMRRDDGGDKANSSAGPSKPTSEDGSDGKDKVPKEKLTREEREEAYNRARERIFGSVDKNGEAAQDDAGVSRASSVSTKDKSNVGRRAKNERRRRDSGSFESRTQYAVYYPSPHQAPWAGQPQYVPIATPQFNNQVQQGYVNQGAAPYGGPNFPAMMPNPGYPQTYSNMQQYPQPNQQRYPPASVGMYGNTPPGPPAQAAWQQPAFNPTAAAYPPAPAGPPAQPAAPNPMGPGVPYMYGQLPSNLNPNDPKTQHPIPGSYNRHAFNPKTQSFVPNAGGPQMPSQAPRYPPPGSHHGSPQIGSPHLAYNPGFQPGVGVAPPPMPPQHFGGGYSMARQGSNNSMMAYHHHPPQHVQQPPPMPQGAQQAMPPHAQPVHPQQVPNKHPIPQGPSMVGQAFSHLPPHYGNPATLPQKPT